MTFGRYPYGGVGYAGSDVAEIPTDTEPHLAVEAAFTTGVWDDPLWEPVTADVRSWDVQRGRRRELERFQPGRATIVLSNLSRQYDSVYEDGDHFGHLKPMKRVRIRETFDGVTYPVFDGFVDKWVLDYPGIGHDATATIVATDMFKVLARTDLPESVYELEVTADAPAYWWRMHELLAVGDEAKVALNSGSAGTAGDGEYRNSVTVGVAGLVVGDPGTSIALDPEALLNSGMDAGAPVNLLQMLEDGEAFTVEIWARPESVVASETYTVFEQQASSPGIDRFWLRWHSTSGTSTGHFQMIAGDIDITSGNNSAPQGERHHVMVTFTPTGSDVVATLYVNGVDEGSDTQSASVDTGTISSITYGARAVATGEQFGGQLQEAAIYLADLGAARASTHNAAGRTPWQDDLTGARAERILDIVGTPEDHREIDAGLTALQSATLGTVALEHLHKLAETEFGLLFITRDGKVRFVDRSTLLGRLPSPAVYGDEAGDVGYRAFVPDDGDETIRNHAIISRLNGSARTSTDEDSVDELGRFDYRLEGLLHRTEAYSQQYANLITSEYGEPRRRVSSLTVGPPIPAEATITYPAILGPELGDVINVTNTPLAGGDPFTQVCAVEGIHHAAKPGGDRLVTFALSPEFALRDWEDTVEIGYAEVAANQGSITAEVDLTGLTVDVTVAADRRIRISGSAYFTNSGTSGYDILKIHQDGTQIMERGQAADTDAHSVFCCAVVTPSAGAHTYKLRAQATAGTATFNAGATFPAFILVEDIGPA